MPQLDEQTRTRLNGALTALSASLASITEEMFLMQIELGKKVLERAISALSEEVNLRNVKDCEFALHDVIGFSGELSAEDAAPLEPSFATLKSELTAIKATVALPDDLLSRLSGLRAKLVARCRAIERATYREPGSPEEPLPYDPATLTTDADGFRAELQRAGFETPFMDRLVAEPGQLRMRDLSDLVDEIDVITE
jgi:hypothetical protein